MLWWCREREESGGGLSWRALLLRERCLVSATVDRACLVCASPSSVVVMVRARSRGISSTGTRTVRRVFDSREFDRCCASLVNLLLFLAEFEASLLQAV